MKEEWKPIKGYEGIYEISSLGKVKNITRNRYRALRLNKDGYVEITLSKYGVNKMVRVHRLVAEAFIPNPEGKPEVNHKDYNRSNNNYENLEWATRKENINYSDLRGKPGGRNHKFRCSRQYIHRSTNTGEHHITFYPKFGTYKVRFVSDGKRLSKDFKNLEDAINYRDSCLEA